MDDATIAENLDQLNRNLQKVEDFVKTKVDALSAARLRQIYEEIAVEGRSISEIATLLAPELDLDRNAYAANRLGSAAYLKSLEFLDKYDDDYRPRPGRDFMGQIDGKVDVYYLPHLRSYDVVLGDFSETFRATYVPRFGIDVSDMGIIEEIADRLLKTSAEVGRHEK